MAHRSEVGAAASLCLALDGDDISPLEARLGDKSLLRVPGLSGLSGDYQGREAIAGVLRRMAVATGGTLHFDLRGATSRRDAVHIEGLLSGTRHGRPARAAVSLDALLDGRMFRAITVECADRSAWDTLWGPTRR